MDIFLFDCVSWILEWFLLSDPKMFFTSIATCQGSGNFHPLDSPEVLHKSAEIFCCVIFCFFDIPHLYFFVFPYTAQQQTLDLIPKTVGLFQSSGVDFLGTEYSLNPLLWVWDIHSLPPKKYSSVLDNWLSNINQNWTLSRVASQSFENIRIFSSLTYWYNKPLQNA